MTHLLDANVFIQAHRTFLNADVAPGYWEWLEQQNGVGCVRSVDAVLEELKGGQDALAEWSKAHDGMFLAPDEAVVDAVRELVTWAGDNDQYSDSAVRDFASDADCFLVAHAKAHDLTVVTMETPSKRQNIVKIPDVCSAFDVKWIGPLELHRNEGLRLVIG